MIKEYVKEKLPSYIIDNDSYKDINGKGFVERYLEIFGGELDDEYIPELEQLIQQKNPQLTRSEFLDYIAGQLGDLPNISQDTAHYRNILSFIVSLWNIRGTKQSYISILYSLGLTGTTITEIPLVTVAYDDPAVSYDATETFAYDTSCQTCSEYYITTTGPTLTVDIYQRLLGLVELVEPINAKLKHVVYNGDTVTQVYISVEVDENGDLVYDNANDPSLVLTLDANGDLIISGPNASRYYIDSNGDLIYLLY